jgi:hypothetical protein
MGNILCCTGRNKELCETNKINNSHSIPKDTPLFISGKSVKVSPTNDVEDINIKINDPQFNRTDAIFLKLNSYNNINPITTTQSDSDNIITNKLNLSNINENRKNDVNEQSNTNVPNNISKNSILGRLTTQTIYKSLSLYEDSESTKKETNYEGEVSEKPDFAYMEEDYCAPQRPAIKSQNVKNNKSKYFIKMGIEYIDIHNKCDNFCYYFKPYLDIQIEDNDILRIYPEKDDKSNNSLVSDNTLNMSSLIRTLSNQIPNKEKTLTFRINKTFEISNRNLYGNIIFSLKNDFNENQPQVTIGETRVPIIKIFNNYRENKFDGMIEMKMKCVNILGYMKVNLVITENNIIDKEIWLDKMQKGKILEDVDEYEPGLSKTVIQFENKNLNIEDISNTSIDKYFLTEKEFDQKEQLLQESNILPRYYIKEEFNDKSIDEFFKKFLINSTNQISLYQSLLLMIEMSCRDDQIIIIYDILRKFSEQEKNIFTDIITKLKKNPYIVKAYLILLYNYLKYFMNNKNIQIRKTRDILEVKLLENIINYLDFIADYKKNSYISSEVDQEILECVMWCLNLIGELIKEGIDIKTNSKSDYYEQKRKEYIVFNNNIEHIYK